MKKYAFFDGDGIGARVEILLTEGKIDEAGEYSEKLKQALDIIAHELKIKKLVRVILYGGDDLLVEYDNSEDERFLEEIRDKYFNLTNTTISCGVGNSIKGALRNLYFAKLYGKNQIRMNHGE